MVSTNQVKSLVVRVALLLHFVLVVWRVTEAMDDMYWLMAAAIIPFILEAFYTIFRRDGVEWKLFSLCFFFYLGATLPGIWLLEIDKTHKFQNESFTELSNVTISGFVIPVRLSPNTWVVVVEEMMMYLMILGRWFLPRGEVGREQLIQLLFGFIGIASDIMELFSIFDEAPQIRENALLTYIILGMWSLSILQFTLTFASVHRSRRARGLRVSPGRDKNADDMEVYRLSVLRMELLATFLSLFMQDGPFLGIRLYTIIIYNVITYGLIFFTAKNALVILLLVYKVFLLLNKICCPSKKKDHHKKLDEEEADDDHDDDLGSVKVVTKSNGQGRTDGMEFWDLRKRREERDNSPARPDPAAYSMDAGDLQRVIEGPATPAKKMDKAKKYDRKISQDKTSEDLEKKTGMGKTGHFNAAMTDDDNQPITKDVPITNDSTTTKIPDGTKEIQDHNVEDSGHQEQPPSDFRPNYEQAPPDASPQAVGSSDLHPNDQVADLPSGTGGGALGPCVPQDDNKNQPVMRREPNNTPESKPGQRKKAHVSVIDVKL